MGTEVQVCVKHHGNTITVYKSCGTSGQNEVECGLRVDGDCHEEEEEGKHEGGASSCRGDPFERSVVGLGTCVVILQEN